jgi:NAD+ synthase (glutamine-hydrolysing)
LGDLELQQPEQSWSVLHGSDRADEAIKQTRSRLQRPKGESRFFNSAVLLHKGVAAVFHKTLLPTYDVFDEDRYFEPAVAPQILDFNGCKLGISICEDVWNDRDFWSRRRYRQDPIEVLANSGAQAILNLSASPFIAGKQLLRERMLGHFAQKYRLPVAYVNQVGGNDDLIFDGRSCAFNAQGRLLGRAAGFREDVLLVDLAGGTSTIAEEDFEIEAEIWNALVLGVHDYVLRRHRFRPYSRHCRRGGGAGKCARCAHALLLFERRQYG